MVFEMPDAKACFNETPNLECSRQRKHSAAWRRLRPYRILGTGGGSNLPARHTTWPAQLAKARIGF